MLKLLAILEGSLFLFLSLLHFYWAFGGKRGFSDGLPTNEQGVRVLNPTKLDSTVVAVALLFFSLYYLNLVFKWLELARGLQKYAGWGIAFVFLLRAIGDFKYVGFFKKIRKTGFGRKDTRYFSPLCLIISILAVLLCLGH